MSSAPFLILSAAQLIKLEVLLSVYLSNMCLQIFEDVLPTLQVKNSQGTNSCPPILPLLLKVCIHIVVAIVKYQKNSWLYFIYTVT